MFSSESRFINVGMFNGQYIRYGPRENQRLVRAFLERFGVDDWLGIVGLKLN